MILLDTNYLINALVPESAEAERIFSWLKQKKELCTSGICWYEFLCGPVDQEEILVMFSIIADRIIPFTADQAVEGSRLFNQTGRKRHLRIDALIAAAAIISNAELATGDTDDFEPFRPLGLKIHDLQS